MRHQARFDAPMLSGSAARTEIGPVGVAAGALACTVLAAATPPAMSAAPAATTATVRVAVRVTGG